VSELRKPHLEENFMRGFTRTFRSLALLVVLVSSLFASSALAANGITASGERYTDGKGNDLKTVSVEFRNIPAEYEGWQATTTESMPVCGVVTNGVVSCEFRNAGPVSGAWLYLYKKGTDQIVWFYVSFHVDGMKVKEEAPSECQQFFVPASVDSCIPL
jgi:hypothetical protein